MSLYIKHDGYNISHRGKKQIDGSIEVTSWPSIDNEPARKSECYWNGEEVALKTNQMLVTEYANKKIEEMRALIYTRWIDSSKAIAAMQAQYNVFKANALSATSTGDVDNEYDILVTWLDIS